MREEINEIENRETEKTNKGKSLISENINKMSQPNWETDVEKTQITNGKMADNNHSTKFSQRAIGNLNKPISMKSIIWINLWLLKKLTQQVLIV